MMIVYIFGFFLCFSKNFHFRSASMLKQLLHHTRCPTIIRNPQIRIVVWGKLAHVEVANP